MKCIEYRRACTVMLPSEEYGHHGSQSSLPTGCRLDDVIAVALLWMCCALRQMEVSFFQFYC